MIKQYLNIIIAIIVASLTFYICSSYYNKKIDKINKEIILNNISLLTQQNKLKDDNLTLINKLKDLENEKYIQYQELQKINSDIKSSVAIGSKRLYVNATCTDRKTETSISSGLDDGENTKAIIDSRDATAIIEITEKADKYKSQLEALQNWINVLILDNNK